MFVVATHQHHPGSVANHAPLLHSPGPQQLGSAGTEATVRTLLSALGTSMERGAAEYSQSGLPSPYPSSYGDARSEASSADHASAAQYATQQPQAQPQQPPLPPPSQQQQQQQPPPPQQGQQQQQQQGQQPSQQQQQEVRPGSTYATSATPTSDYSVYPQSARSTSFPDHIQRPYHPASTPGGSSGGMAQTPTSPSPVPVQDGRSHQKLPQDKSDSAVPIDPSIAAPSPTYAHGQYSPYAPPGQDMSHGYPHSGGLYAQPRPDWTGYSGQPTPITPSHHVFPQTPTSAAPQARPNQVGLMPPPPPLPGLPDLGLVAGRRERPADAIRQVYSFVPIPGAQQHKRPRRRYEEIERMYKCGWNGCEKAYGTLNHLNAHVTMQSHGQKRTPEGTLNLLLAALAPPCPLPYFEVRQSPEPAAYYLAYLASCVPSLLLLAWTGRNPAAWTDHGAGVWLICAREAEGGNLEAETGT